MKESKNDDRKNPDEVLDLNDFSGNITLVADDDADVKTTAESTASFEFPDSPVTAGDPIRVALSSPHSDGNIRPGFRPS